VARSPYLFRGFGNGVACLLGLSFFMCAMNFFASGFLPGLGNMRGTFGKILSMFLLFVDDFLIVGNVSRIGHSSL
jgi:hypothetical protein